jgi:hypothetical protein
MHTSEPIQQEKARLREEAGLTLDKDFENDFSRGRERQMAHRQYQDEGNAVLVLSKGKRAWLIKKANIKDGKLLCKYHTGK